MKKLKYKILRSIPLCLIRIIDPFSYLIERFVLSLSKEIPPHSRILDAGSGETPFKKFFKDHKYVAIDTRWGDPDWDYSKLNVIGDLIKLPFKKEIFNAALCTQVLEHVKEPKAILKELYRVLKLGGVLYLSAPQGWGIHQAPHDYFRFTSYALRYLLEEAEFEIVYIKPCCGYFGYLANRLTVFPKVLFWQIKCPWLRILLAPLELVSYLLFVLIFPLILNAIDFLDHERTYTLNYFVKARKS